MSTSPRRSRRIDKDKTSPGDRQPILRSRSQSRSSRQKLNMKSILSQNERARDLETGTIGTGLNLKDDDLVRPSVSTATKKISLEDKASMILLFVLYALQGIPMGFSSSIPLILKERGASYTQLGMFSMVGLPFSLKLLWAPLVDSTYFKSIGRRKTWLVPVQLLTGFIMIWYSSQVGFWLNGDDVSINTANQDGSSTQAHIPDVSTLTMFFMLLYFMMATQDVAVDGWALTMLSRENVGYASTCNSIGQSFGFFIASQGFLALSDATWCQRFLGMDQPLLTIVLFLKIAGWAFIVVTLLVCIIKKELPLPPEEEPEGLLVTYKHVWTIMQLKAVQALSIILLTMKVSFAPADSVSRIKMQEFGMPKADIATFSPIILLVGLITPAVVAGWVSRDPLQAVLWTVPVKLCTTALTWLVIQAVPAAYAENTQPSFYFFAALLVVSAGHEVANGVLSSALMSLFAKVSVPSIGGTYMTFLNTINNIGFRWSNSAAIWAAGSISNSYADGYTVLTGIAVVYGILWIFFMFPSLKWLELLPLKEWEIPRYYAISKTDGKGM